jgi:hypothetical protein
MRRRVAPIAPRMPISRRRSAIKSGGHGSRRAPRARQTPDDATRRAPARGSRDSHTQSTGRARPLSATPRSRDERRRESHPALAAAEACAGVRGRELLLHESDGLCRRHTHSGVRNPRSQFVRSSLVHPSLHEAGSQHNRQRKAERVARLVLTDLPYSVPSPPYLPIRPGER